MELAGAGEVMFLPAHGRSTFNGLIFTRAASSCAAVTQSMLDVESYPQRFSVKKAHIKERTATTVTYELELDIALAPNIPGKVEHPHAGKVIFHDVETGAQFIWTMQDSEGGCAMQYSMLEVPGKPSGWTAVVRRLERSILDAANFGAGMSSSRGYTKPEAAARLPQTSAGQESWDALARAGTAVRLERRKGETPKVIARRTINRPLSDVLWSIRNRHSYEDKLEFFSSVKDQGQTVRYRISAFGGRVTFNTKVSESGDVKGAGLVIDEKVTGGDLKEGAWQWRVKELEGGSVDVELSWDVDIADGSSLMTALANTDPITRDAMGVHFALELMGNVVGGTPVGAGNLAKH